MNEHPARTSHTGPISSSAPAYDAKAAKSGIAAARGQGGAHAGAGVRTVTVELPLPPKECHQNRSGRVTGWREEAAVRREARMFACMAVVKDRGEDAPRFWPEFGPCMVSVLFRWPDRRRRDLANYVGAIKPYLDGLMDANVYRDDANIVDLRARGCIDREHPGVTITVTPVTETEGNQ